jgi:hypothetical protein
MRAANSFIEDGIGSEDFDLIPTNQDLYTCNPPPSDPSGTIYKFPHTLLNHYVGDLLITQSGDGDFRYDAFDYASPELFIVYWDPTNFVFNARGIPGPTNDLEFEHVTFAPINLPSQPVQ